jgi:hypothetical protein
MTGEPYKPFCTYVYRDPRSQKLIYVGKGATKTRPNSHWKFGAQNMKFARILKEIKDLGMKPVVEIVGYFDNEEDALRLEDELIIEHKDTICNVIGVPLDKPIEHRMPFVTARDQIDRIDRWRGRQLPIPSRNEAIKRLVDRGLDAEERDAEKPDA